MFICLESNEEKSGWKVLIDASSMFDQCTLADAFLAMPISYCCNELIDILQGFER